MAIGFVRTSSQYAEAASPGYEDDFTVSFWLYPTDVTPSSGNYAYAVNWQAASIARIFAVGWRNTGVLWAWWYRKADSTNRFDDSTLSVTLNTWQHVAFVFSNTGNVKTIYHNGTGEALGAQTSTANSFFNNLRLSRGVNQGQHLGSCRLAEVAIWPNRLMTAEEIGYLAEGGDPLDLGEPGRYWPLRDNADLRDWIGESSLSLVNSPTTQEHAPLWVPGQSYACAPSGNRRRRVLV